MWCITAKSEMDNCNFICSFISLPILFVYRTLVFTFVPLLVSLCLVIYQLYTVYTSVFVLKSKLMPFEPDYFRSGEEMSCFIQQQYKKNNNKTVLLVPLSA